MNPSPLAHRIRDFLTLALLAVLGATFGCAGGQEVTSEAIKQSRQLWANAGIRDYDLDWTVTGAQNNHYFVTVHGGEVRKVETIRPDGQRFALKPADTRFYGVDGLFLDDRRRVSPAQDRSSLWPAGGDESGDAVQARRQAGLSPVVSPRRDGYVACDRNRRCKTYTQDTSRGDQGRAGQQRTIVVSQRPTDIVMILEINSARRRHPALALLRRIRRSMRAQRSIRRVAACLRGGMRRPHSSLHKLFPEIGFIPGSLGSPRLSFVCAQKSASPPPLQRHWPGLPRSCRLGSRSRVPE